MGPAQVYAVRSTDDIACLTWATCLQVTGPSSLQFCQAISSHRLLEPRLPRATAAMGHGEGMLGLWLKASKKFLWAGQRGHPGGVCIESRSQCSLSRLPSGITHKFPSFQTPAALFPSPRKGSAPFLYAYPLLPGWPLFSLILAGSALCKGLPAILHCRDCFCPPADSSHPLPVPCIR